MNSSRCGLRLTMAMLRQGTAGVKLSAIYFPQGQSKTFGIIRRPLQ